MLKTTALAAVNCESSRGQEVAKPAASAALSLPFDCPIPINAVPASVMMLRTSAKSTLINPGLMMISEMPTTPCLKISSAYEEGALHRRPFRHGL